MASYKKVLVEGDNISHLNNDSGYLTSVGNVAWGNITSKPSIFMHDYATVTGNPTFAGTTTFTGDIYTSGHIRPTDGVLTIFNNTSGSWGHLNSMGINLGDWYRQPSYGQIAVGAYTFRVFSGDDKGSTTLLSVNQSGVMQLGDGGNSTNWNSAYSWGNHASAGYLKSVPSSLGATTFTGDVLVSEYIRHFEDSDTNIRFQTDHIDFTTSAGLALRIDDSQKATFSQGVSVINSVPFLYVGDNVNNNSGTWDANIFLDSHANSRLRIQQRSDAKNLELWVHGGYDPLIQATDSANYLRLGVGGNVGLELGKYSVYLRKPTYVESLRANNSSGLITIYNQGYGSKGNLDLNNITGAESTFTTRVNTGQIRFTDSSKTSFNHLNVSQWHTAYTWGNHASAGYSKFSGSYNDLSNKPTIPTDYGNHASAGYWSNSNKPNISTIPNNAGYITNTNAHYSFSNNDYGPHYANDSTNSKQNNSAMSIKLWDSYNNASKGSPTDYGTILDIYGRNGHERDQLYFGNLGQIYHRNTFYGNNAWNNWYKIHSTKNLEDSFVTKLRNNSGNWDTAYGWGNHADAKYLTSHQSLSNYATLNSNSTFSSNVSVGGNLETDTVTNYRGNEPVKLWTDKVIVGKTGHQSTPNKLVLRGHSVPYSGGGHLAGEGWLEFDSLVSWTGGQRKWAITNAWGMGINNAYTGNLTFLVGTDSAQTPTIGMNGALGTANGEKTVIGMRIDGSGVIHARTGNSTNWNTAYGWGNHASAGYATTSSNTFSGNQTAPRLIASDNSHTLTMGHWSGGLRIEGNGTEPMYIGTHHNADLKFRTAGVDRHTFHANGNSTFSGDIFIHKGVPQLELKDTANNTRGYIGINNGVLKVGSKDNVNLHFQTNGTDRGYFLANGTFVALGAMYSGSVHPNSGGSYDLGSNSARWRQIHTNAIYVDGRTVTGGTIDQIGQGVGAYNWGNHASAGYFKNGQLITGGGYTNSGSYAMAHDSEMTKKIYIAFDHGTANQKANIFLGGERFWGEIIVTVVSGYSHQNASGVLKVSYGVGLNQNGAEYSNGYTTLACSGQTPSNFSLDDAWRYDSSAKKWYLVVSHLNANGNQAYITLEAKSAGGSSTYIHEAIKGAYAGSVYTNTNTYPNRGFQYSNSFNIKAPNLLVGSYLNAEKFNNMGSTANGISIAGEHAPTLSLWDTSSSGFHSHLSQVGSDLTLRSSGTFSLQIAGGTRAMRINTDKSVTFDGTVNGTELYLSNRLMVSGSNSYMRLRDEKNASQATWEYTSNEVRLYNNNAEDLWFGVNASKKLEINGSDGRVISHSWLQANTNMTVASNLYTNSIQHNTAGDMVIGNKAHDIRIEGGAFSVVSGTNNPMLRLMDSSYNIHGYLYANNTNGFGFLADSGHWAYNITPNSQQHIWKIANVEKLKLTSSSMTQYGDNFTISGGNPRIYAVGDSNGYVNGAFVTSSKDINRGGGLFMHDRGNDNEWFCGRPYSNNDQFIIARNTGVADHSGATAQATNELWRVDNNAYVHSHVNISNSYRLKGTNNYPRFERSGDDAYIGTNSQNTAFYLYDNGNARVTGSFTAYQGNSNEWNTAYSWGDHSKAGYQTGKSDVRLKKDIKPIEKPLEKLSKIRGVDFTWKSDNEKGGGVIAQELEKAMPEYVHDLNNGTGHKTVDYNGLIGVLIESVKELKEQVNNCKCQCNCKGE